MPITIKTLDDQPTVIQRMKLRRRQEFPDPSREGHAEVNRHKKLVGFRLTEKYRERVAVIAAHYNVKPAQYLEIMVSRLADAELSRFPELRA